MAVASLEDDYDVQPVEGNPFGTSGDSPNNYDVQPVDHDPFVDHGDAPPDVMSPAQMYAAQRPQPARPPSPTPTPTSFAPPEATPSTAGGPPMSDRDRDLLIKTVYGEARGEPDLGKIGVTHAILNRVKSGNYGQGISGVVLAPAAGVSPRLGYHEFSPWNTGRATEGQPAINTLPRDNPKAYAQIGDLVDKAYNGLIPDPTGGATHYYGRWPSGKPLPKWVAPLAAQNQVKIGATTFVGREQGPGYTPRYAGDRSGFDDGGGVTDLGQSDDDQLASQDSPLPAPLPDPAPPMTSQDVLAHGGFGTIGPADLPPSQRLQQSLETGAESLGQPRGLGTLASTVANYAPVSGQVLSGADAYHYGSEGDYGQAALAGAGAVPDVGKFVAPIAHAAAPLAHSMAPVGAMFLGPMARDVDLGALDAAKRAYLAGDNPHDIWRQHGWESGPADTWRTEIADPLRTQNWGQHGDVTTIGNIYPHPELYANYPGLENKEVVFRGDMPPDMYGGYHPGLDTFIMNANLPESERTHVVTHELQHAIQARERWPGGANPNDIEVHKPGTPGNTALNFILNQMTAAERRQMGRPAIVQAAKHLTYQTTSGEVQAEGPFARLGMPMWERRDIHPALTEGLTWPRSSQWWKDPITGQTTIGGEDLPPRASGGAVEQNEALRRRLALLMKPRHGFQAGGGSFMSEEERLQQEREGMTSDTGMGSGSELGMGGFQARSPGFFGGARPVEPSPAAGAASSVDEPSFSAPAPSDTTTEPAPAGIGHNMGPAMGSAPAPEPAAPSIVRGEDGLQRHVDPAFPESRISTSTPTAVDAPNPHGDNSLQVGMDLASGDVAKGRITKKGDYRPGYADKVTDLIRGEDDDGNPVLVSQGKNKPKVQPITDVQAPQLAENAPREDVNTAWHEALIEHMKNNILGVYNRVSDAVKNGSRRWYEGANNIAKNIAIEHDIPHENAAGVVAALSPQKDWDMNVALARRVAHTAANTADDATFSPEMEDWMRRYAAQKDPESERPVLASGKPDPKMVSQEDVLADLERLKGVTWGQMTGKQRAIYVRALDETSGPPDHLMPIDEKTGEPSRWQDDNQNWKYGFHINNPDGTDGGILARTDKGARRTLTWGSFGEIESALDAFHAPNMGAISEAMGAGHKVRSFYNNIIAPWSQKGDLTGDTQAAAVAFLRPLGASSPAAKLGMGQEGPGIGATGVSGLYPHVAEAYRRAADEVGVLPREMQSITWEAIRGLWGTGEKTKTSVLNAVGNAWKKYQSGEWTMNQVHDAILGPQGENIKTPRWWNSWRPS